MFSPFENSKRFQSFQAIQEYLNNLGLFHMDLSLDRMVKILARLFPAGMPFQVVQVVGTNGKGSTAHFVSSLATAHALKNGLFTSPHFVSMRERVRINGKMLPEEEWLTCANIVAAAESNNPQAKLTYFEFITVLALLAFARAELKLAVLEAGLGGEYDATSAVFADLLLITPISLDHQNVLGQSILEITANKAGAIKPGQLIITSEQPPEVLALLKARANARGNSLFKPVCPPQASQPAGPNNGPNSAPSILQTSSPPLGMQGVQQANNSRLALAGFSRLAQKMGWPLRAPAIRRGLGAAFIPGRMQFIPALFTRPPLLLDGAHNEHSFELLRYNLNKMEITPRAIIFSCLADKNLDQAFALFAEWCLANPRSPIFIIPLLNNPRAANPCDLAARIGPQAKIVENMKQALCLAEQTSLPANSENPNRYPVLICGSLYLLADFFSLHPGYLEAK